MKEYLDSRALFKLLWAWKIHLALLGGAVMLLAVLFSSSLFITPLYKSQARLYPVNARAFSEESESEQMLEVIGSSDLKRKMIETFSLVERYKIDSQSRAVHAKVLKAYDKHVTCVKTRYETVEISILDRDPKMACAMVDSLMSFYNAKMLAMHREKYQGQLAAFQQDMSRKQADIDSLDSRLSAYRQRYGLLDYQSQTEQLTLGYAEALARGASRASVDELKKRLDLLAERGGTFRQMQARMTELLQQREQIGRQLEEILSQINRRENFSVLVEAPFPADKKSYPTRWLIVLASLLSAEFLAVLLILLMDSSNQVKS
ncbi:hypothetical protein C8N47_13312 [Mangrovibacterium marinum]|uniref:Subunit length determinant protein n=1 Tax=Mangrovibacterium marinum TaxID=1639118 RepID=A0A2T5BWZ7_9BACT|nr:hypothetical protein [Mangrovibacterium marinum]PTN04247.1 hypothetical protein C8N47_13312 [Mangrovibacterium marinum]